MIYFMARLWGKKGLSYIAGGKAKWYKPYGGKFGIF